MMQSFQLLNTFVTDNRINTWLILMYKMYMCINSIHLILRFVFFMKHPIYFPWFFFLFYSLLFLVQRNRKKVWEFPLENKLKPSLIVLQGLVWKFKSPSLWFFLFILFWLLIYSSLLFMIYQSLTSCYVDSSFKI